MNDLTTHELLKKTLRRLDLNFISHVGYPADEQVPYPEGFLEGYHKCIEDFINETKRLGFDLNVQRNQTVG